MTTTVYARITGELGAVRNNPHNVGAVPAGRGESHDRRKVHRKDGDIRIGRQANILDRVPIGQEKGVSVDVVVVRVGFVRYSRSDRQS